MMELIYFVIPAFFVIGTGGEFTLEIVPSQAKVGDSVELHCHVSKERDGQTFEWFRLSADDSKDVIAEVQTMTNKHLTERHPNAFRMETADEILNYEDSTLTIVIQVYSNTCLERPHVRVVALDRWSLFTGVQIEDNARYGCGPEGATVITSRLTVIKKPEGIKLIGSESPPAPDDPIRPFSKSQLVGIPENTTYYFLCLVESSIPAAVVTITYNEDLEQGETNITTTLTDAQYHPEYNYELYSTATPAQIAITRRTQRQILTCEAKVADLVLNATTRLAISGGPVMQCWGAHVPVGERHVYISCVVDAYPGVTYLTWMWDTPDGSSVELRAGEDLNENYTSTRFHKTNGLVESSLVFPTVSEEMFGNYSLFARNDYGVSYGETKLTLDPYRVVVVQEVKTNASTSPAAAVTLFVLIATMRFLMHEVFVTLDAAN